MAIRRIICASLGEFLCAKLEISLKTQENISKKNISKLAERRQIFQNLNDRFSLNFPDSYMAIRRIICASLGEFLCAKLEISLKTQENISKLAVRSERRQIFQNLNDRFSLNFPDSYMAIRRIICASLGEFLCAKLEISLKTQENIYPNLEIFSCVLSDISSLAHRNSPKLAQIIRLIAILLSGKFKENLPFKF